MTRQIPEGTRRGMVAGAVVLVVIAAAVNVAHTRQNAIDNGQDHWPALVIGLLPDVGLVLSVMRLRYDRRSPWAWAGLSMSIGLVAWSALATADGSGLGPRLMALVCLAWAIVYTGQAHVPHGEPIEATVAHLEAIAEDTERTAARAVDRANAAAGEAVERAERLAVDLANAVADRERVVAALAAERSATAAAKPTTERRPNAASDQHVRPAKDVDVAGVYAAWIEREGTERPMPNDELSRLLGVSVDAARTRANRWRKKANGPSNADAPEGSGVAR